MEVPQILKTIWSWIKSKFEKLNKQLIPIADVAVDITNALKGVVESGAADVIVAITPTKVDDKILAAVRTALPKVIQSMTVVQGIAHENDSPEVAAQKLIEQIKKLVPDSQAFQWLEFSSKLTKELAIALEDDDISITEAINLAHQIYNAIKK